MKNEQLLIVLLRNNWFYLSKPETTQAENYIFTTKNKVNFNLLIHNKLSIIFKAKPKKMGTSIECFIPKEKDYSTEEIQKKFKTLYGNLSAEFSQVEINGQFIIETNGNWRIQIVSSENEPEYILGEGDGFGLKIYKNVIILSCIERIGSFYREERNISSNLYRIFSAFAKEFRDSNLMLITQGGVGDTDHISDMAYYDNANFHELCQKMRELHGEPTKELNRLSEIVWYFQD